MHWQVLLRERISEEVHRVIDGGQVTLETGRMREMMIMRRGFPTIDKEQTGNRIRMYMNMRGWRWKMCGIIFNLVLCSAYTTGWPASRFHRLTTFMRCQCFLMCQLTGFCVEIITTETGQMTNPPRNASDIILRLWIIWRRESGREPNILHT